MNKQKIQSRFNAANKSYEKEAHVQKECAHILTSMLVQVFPDFYPSSVLDLGAGTGYVTECLLPSFPDSSYTLNDNAAHMLAKAKEKFTTHKFYLADMETADFGHYDLIISNFALQWVHHLEDTLYKFYTKSTVFAFSCLLEGTFVEWENILKIYGLSSPMKKYPTEEELIDFLSSLGAGAAYHADVRNFELKFSNALSFMTYLKNLGASASHNPLSPQGIKNLIKNHTQEFKVTYKVFFGIIPMAVHSA